MCNLKINSKNLGKCRKLIKIIILTLNQVNTKLSVSNTSKSHSSGQFDRLDHFEKELMEAVRHSVSSIGGGSGQMTSSQNPSHIWNETRRINPSKDKRLRTNL